MEATLILTSPLRFAALTWAAGGLPRMAAAVASPCFLGVGGALLVIFFLSVTTQKFVKLYRFSQKGPFSSF